MAQSQIRAFYKDQNVFITGGTGFLGKVLIEKLLRSTEVATIYVLMRAKKGKDAQTRLHDMLDSILFRKLKLENPNFINRVIGLEGDCTLESLGLSASDLEKLASNVNIVFHSAATVKMNEPIETAYNINVKGTKQMLSLCSKFQNLKSLVHVSTAFSNCHLDTIEEIFYDFPFTCDKLEALMTTIPKNEPDKMTSEIIGKWPNTYNFTKALTEAMIKDTFGNLPLGVFRPAVVSSTYREPVESWTDNLGGPNIFVLIVGLGLTRAMTCDNFANTDLVPVDLTISALIATAWDVYNRRKESDIPIYNYVSSTDNPISYREFLALNALQIPKNPSKNAMWARKFMTMEKSALFFLIRPFYNYLPALFLDFLRIVCFKKPEMFSKVRKIDSVGDLLSFFTGRDWIFTNENVKQMWKKMDEEDKEEFNFDIRTVEWVYYMRNYWKGFKLYLLKEDESSLPEAKRRYFWLQVVHYGMIFLVYFIIMNLIWTVLFKIFS